MSKGKRRIVLLAAALLIISSSSLSAAPSSLSQHRSRLSQLQDLIRKQRDKLYGIKKKERDASKRLRRTRGALNETRSEIVRINGRLSDVQTRLDVVRTDLAAARSRVETQRSEIEERLTRIYKYGRVSYMEVVLGANDFTSFANRLNFLRLVMRQDMGLFNDYVRHKEALAAAEREVASREAEIRSLQNQVRQKERLYRIQAASQGAALQDIRSQRAVYEQQLAELEANSRQIERMIQRMMRTPSGRKRSAVAWTGRMAAPVSGRITSGFGMRTHPIFRTRRMHTGVDISVPTGTPVRASGAGEVIYTGTFGGYGVTVIIDHGGGISTLYAHNSRVACHAGQRVRQGQVISYSGSTGYSTGPHLHWEVRQNGTPINPMGR